MKTFKKILKIIGLSISGVIGFVIVAVLSLNLAKFAIYFDYYRIESRICGNPGLNEGAIPQGVASDENHDFILTTAYMQNKSHSRVYKCTNSGNSYVKLVKNGEKFTNHVGGIGLDKDTIYISNGSRIYTIPLANLDAALAGDGYLEVGEGTKINNKASYCSVIGDYLYVGEYSDGKDETTNTKIEANNKIYRAVITKYHTDDLTTPIEMYAVRNRVQGVTLNNDGDIYISTSYGLTSSNYYKYSKDILVNPVPHVDQLGDTVDLYFLDDHIRHIVGPAMAEDLTFKDDRVITLTESASNKYIFGKYFFAYDIVGLKF